MGIRPEHLAGLVRRGQDNEAMLRLFVLDGLIELVEVHLEHPKKLQAALEIYESLQADEGKYVFTDFRAAMLEATSSSKVDLSPILKRRMDLYLRFLFPE